MRIGIIGGGASGLMALVSAYEANPRAELHLIERNGAVGRKVLLTGGGRCNVTTALADVDEVLKRYPRGADFLRFAMGEFPPAAVRAWFEAHGVPLKEEADHRVFPKSNDGRDIVAVFEKYFREPNITVHLNAVVEGVTLATDRQFLVRLRGQATPMTFDRIIITTGGQAYRQTGSTGDGYSFAAGLGHVITPLAASLSALNVSETWVRELAGVSFERARIFTTDGDKGFTGPFVFSHHGITGPAAFALSSLIAQEAVSAQKPLEIRIDFLPDLNAAVTTERLNRACQAAPTRHFGNALATLVPKSLADLAVREIAVAADRYAGKIGKKDMARAVAWLKAMPLHVIGRESGEEFVTAGGIDLKDVDPKTMESRLVRGLFFAGELLDIDAFTGGFNLQAAWATGRLAGRSAVA